MKELFEWHAAEEIEHRCVAYDVLQAVDDSYALRVAGLLNAYLMLFGFSSACTVYLIANDREILNKAVIKDALDTLFFKEGLFIKSVQICLRYLEKDFHPSNQDVDSLAEEVFGVSLGSPDEVKNIILMNNLVYLKKYKLLLMKQLFMPVRSCMKVLLREKLQA